MSSQSPTALSILIPAFQEAQGIAEVVREIVKRHPEAEIIVCDDGSTDGTAAKLDGIPVRVIRHRRNRGYGATWKTLATVSQGQLLIFFDGDGQFDPDDVARLLDERIRTGADMVSGRRASGPGNPLARRPGKWVMHRFANWISGRPVPDINCGLRLVEREIFLRYLSLLPEGFSASTTSLLAYLASHREVSFVPITVRPRVGTSSVRIVKDGFRSLLLIVRLTTLFAPLRVFGPIAAGLLVIGLSYGLWEAVQVGLGFPVLGAVLIINGITVFLFGILADQISALRLNGLHLN